MKPDAAKSAGISAVRYAHDGDSYQIGWRWWGDAREFGMESQDLKRLIQAALLAVAAHREEEISIYLRALTSIARATCCGSCSEAAIVARTALEEATGQRRGAADRLTA